MSIYSLTGEDVLIIGQGGNERIITEVPNGDVVTLEFPNEMSSVMTGKNGNSIIAVNFEGSQIKVIIRILAGSNDDIFLNGILNEYLRKPASFKLLTGQFIKKYGDGDGNIRKVEYSLQGGVFTKLVSTKENVSGDTEQSVAVFELTFCNGKRNII